MRKFIFLSCLYTSLSFAHTLQLERFDEAKLGEFLDALPDHLTSRSVENDLRADVRVITISFPKQPEAFSMRCARRFFNEAEFPSETECNVQVDLNHPSSVLKHDVVRITEKDPEKVRALYETIPYGSPQKKFYSYHRDAGVTFDGDKGTVFHYQIICSEMTCWFKFSHKILVP